MLATNADGVNRVYHGKPRRLNDRRTDKLVGLNL